MSRVVTHKVISKYELWDMAAKLNAITKGNEVLIKYFEQTDSEPLARVIRRDTETIKEIVEKLRRLSGWYEVRA
jgi:hypothetical protein